MADTTTTNQDYYSYIQIGTGSAEVKIRDLEAAHKAEEEVISEAWQFTKIIRVGDDGVIICDGTGSTSIEPTITFTSLDKYKAATKVTGGND